METNNHLSFGFAYRNEISSNHQNFSVFEKSNVTLQWKLTDWVQLLPQLVSFSLSQIIQ
jgi:hypothetical protein